MSRALVLLAGDVPVAVAGRSAPRLEIERGVVRVVAAGRTTAFDVTGCRLHPVNGDLNGLTAPFAFVDPAGEVRCRLDLAEWMPGFLRADPLARPNERARWIDRVADRVSDASGAGREKRVVATAGPRVRAVPVVRVRVQAAVQLAAVVAAVAVTYLAIWTGSASAYVAGGALALLLVVVTCLPRAWWPRRGVPARERVALAAPRGVRPGELALGPDGVLVQTTADGVRRWFPADGPTAPDGAAVAADPGRAVLRLPGVDVDVTPRDATALTRLLREAGVKTSRSAVGARPPASPMPPTGGIGDARWQIGLLLTVLGAVVCRQVVSSPVGLIEYGLATVLAALASARAALTGVLLRRELR